MADYWDINVVTPAGPNDPLIFGPKVATTATETMFFTAAFSTIPGDNVVLSDAPTVLSEPVYDTFYERIWVYPSVLRLTNPKLNDRIDFTIWNAFRVANTLTSVAQLDAAGVVFDEPLPLAFDRYEVKLVAFYITPSAPAELNGYLVFDFTLGEGRLQILAILTQLITNGPELPVVEVWQWKTVIAVAYNGKEQRTALRDVPRLKLQHDLLIGDEVERRLLFDQLFGFAIRDVQIPLYGHGAKLTAAAAIGATKVFCDVANGWFQPGYAGIYISGETFKLVRIVSVDADGVNLQAPLDVAFNVGTPIVPSVSARMAPNTTLSMGPIAGSVRLSTETTQRRDFVRPGQSTTLTLLDGLPILTVRPLANDDVNDVFTIDAETIDNGMTAPATYSGWANPFIGGSRQFLIHRPAGFDYWRAFASYCNGMRNPFLLPTFREDLTVPLAVPPVLSSSLLIIDQLDYATRWETGAFKRLMIQTANGTIYRTVTSVDDTPEGLQLTLSSPFGDNPGDATIKRISFLYLARLDSDEITLEHGAADTVLSLDIRTINE